MSDAATSPPYRAEILQSIALPDLSVDISRFDFSRIRDVPFEGDQHVFGLSLTEQPRNSCGRYASTAMGYVPSGNVTFKPAGTTVLASNDGGSQTVLCCRISDRRFRSTLGRPVNWGTGALSAALNVTGPDIAHNLRRLADELGRPGVLSRTFIESVATMLAVDLVREFEVLDGAPVRKGGLTPLQLARLRARIEDEEQPIASVADLSRLAGLSERHLLRGFKASTGMSLRDRLRDVMTARARFWLSDGGMPVKVVAGRLGYSSQASFTTAFSRSTDETPCAFRRRSRAGTTRLCV